MSDDLRAVNRECGTEYVGTIPQAISKALYADLNAGMHTKAFTVEAETHFLKVIRKCASSDHPSVILFKCIPKNGRTPDYDQLSEYVTEAADLYGDIRITFKPENPTHTQVPRTAVIDAKLI
jgi:phage FluMu gp28-like protein